MPAASIVPLPAEDARIAVIGLGYVGLPLAVAFGAVRPDPPPTPASTTRPAAPRACCS